MTKRLERKEIIEIAKKFYAKLEEPKLATDLIDDGEPYLMVHTR